MSKRKQKFEEVAEEEEELQSFLNDFQEEIEEESVETATPDIPTDKAGRKGKGPANKKNQSDAKDAKDEDEGGEMEADDDENMYFFDAQGTCYIKAKPPKNLQIEKVVAKKPPIKICSSSRSPRPASPAKKPAEKREKISPLKAMKTRSAKTKATPVEPTPSKTKQNKAKSSAVKEEEPVAATMDEEEEEEVAEPKEVASKQEQVEEIYDFEETLTEANDDSNDEDYIVSGQELKLKPVESSKPDYRFKCNECHFCTDRKFIFTRHMRSHDPERPYKCSMCDRGFKTNVGLNNHLNTHLGRKPHSCKKCDSAFTTSGELIRHVRYKHTKEKPHKCSECSYASVELSKLRRHMTCHTGERPYQCPHCTYASPDMFKLKRHSVVHTGEKNYQCDICLSRFTQSNSLKAHKLIHSVMNKPVFKCAFCTVTCGRKADLRQHINNMHNSDNPIPCKRCGQELPDRYSYKLHIKSHEGEKCFTCPHCAYASVSQRHLETHILIHTDERPFKCEECPMAFRQPQLLKRHINIMHRPDYVPPEPRDKQHSCPTCKRKFIHKGNLMRHMEIHDPSLNLGIAKMQLKVGRTVRVPKKDVESQDGQADEDEDLADDDGENDDVAVFELQGYMENGDDEEFIVPVPVPKARRRPAVQKSKKEPVIINSQLNRQSNSKLAKKTGPTPQKGNAIRIKEEEPDAIEYTVEVDGEDEEFMVLKVVNNDEGSGRLLNVKTEKKTNINESNCFGFEDDLESYNDVEELEQTETEVASQDFIQLMSLIEQDA